MTMIHILCIIAALALASTAQALPKSGDSLAEEFKEWAQEKLLEAVDQLEAAEQDLKNKVREAIEDSHAELQTEYANQMLEYHSRRDEFHPQCFHEGLSKFTAYQLPVKPDVESLINYAAFDESNSTTPAPNCVKMALKDLGNITVTVASFTADIISTMNDVVNGYALCATSLVTKFTCVFTYITTTIKSVFNILTNTPSKIRSIFVNGEDIAAQIYRCFHPKQMEIKQQMMLAMNHAYTCTREKLL